MLRPSETLGSAAVTGNGAVPILQLLFHHNRPGKLDDLDGRVQRAAHALHNLQRQRRAVAMLP
jgi:hypothetical protein